MAEQHIMRASVRWRRVAYPVFLLFVLVGGLITYKGAKALSTLEAVHATHTFKGRPDVVPVTSSTEQINIIARSMNYFGVIWPALLFGVLISGAVRAFVPPDWIARLFGGGRVRSQLIGAASGAPLMLCSCCVAPIFTGVYERSTRLGPSLAVMLAAPALNPATLVLTFMLFGSSIGFVRFGMSLIAVILPGIIGGPASGNSPVACSNSNQPQPGAGPLQVAGSFVRSSLKVAAQTVPFIIVGVVLSMTIAERLPISAFVSSTAVIIAVAVAALIAVPLAVPTFFEIPMALALMAAGAPAGVAVALLIAGPAVNLPSLLTVARSTNWRVSAMVAAMVWLVAVAGGLIVSFL